MPYLLMSNCRKVQAIVGAPNRPVAVERRRTEKEEPKKGSK